MVREAKAASAACPRFMEEDFLISEGGGCFADPERGECGVDEVGERCGVPRTMLPLLLVRVACNNRDYKDDLAAE
jgi:hypothetical protein